MCSTTTPESLISIRFVLRPGVFEKSALNDLKMSLNIAMPKVHVPPICCTRSPVSQILDRFALRTAVYELQAISSQLH